jgi:hypothetical protein
MTAFSQNALYRFFSNLDAQIAQLGDEFTFEQYLTRAIEDQPDAYYDLVRSFVLDSHTKSRWVKDNPFLAAQYAVGITVEDDLKRLGYEVINEQEWHSPTLDYLNYNRPNYEYQTDRIIFRRRKEQDGTV